VFFPDAHQTVLRLLIDEDARSQDDFERLTQRAITEAIDVSLLSRGDRYEVQSPSGNRYEVNVIVDSCTGGLRAVRRHRPQSGSAGA
jgi:hypothetical protein